MEVFNALIDIVLSSDILLYLGLIADGIMSIFLLCKNKTKNISSNIADIDLSKLLAYHEKMVDKLKKIKGE